MVPLTSRFSMIDIFWGYSQSLAIDRKLYPLEVWQSHYLKHTAPPNPALLLKWKWHLIEMRGVYMNKYINFKGIDLVPPRFWNLKPRFFWKKTAQNEAFGTSGLSSSCAPWGLSTMTLQRSSHLAPIVSRNIQKSQPGIANCKSTSLYSLY